MLQRQTAGIIHARPRTPMEMTATTVRAAHPDNNWVRLISISIASWILVLALFVLISYDLIGRLLAWFHAA